MQDNPYSPPNAPVSDPPRAPGSAVKAVLVGLAVDVGGSLVAGVVVAFLYAVALGTRGMNEKEVATALANIPPGSWVGITGTLLGAVFSFLGGFCCARIARRSEYRLGSILAILSAATSLALTWQAYDLLQNVLFTLCTVACVLLGARYGRVENAA